MEPTGSVPFLQQSAVCRYLNLRESSPHAPILFLADTYNIILNLHVVSSGFLTKTLCTVSSPPVRSIRPAHLILDLITRSVSGEDHNSRVSSLAPHRTNPNYYALLLM